MAMTVAAGSSLSPLELLAREKVPYPPALTGMRGSHPGAFEVAHGLALGGANWARPATQTDKEYDLVVVGGGISGLSAAFLFRQRAGPDARILVIDNHDDFGGHARRNEFDVDGAHLIGYGGSQSIDSPSTYSPAAAGLLRDIGIDVKRFYEYFDRDWAAKRGLDDGVYFSAERYGKDCVRPALLQPYSLWRANDPQAIIDGYPMSEAARASFLQILTEPRDYLDGMAQGEKTELMRRISYSDYLRKYVGAHDEVIAFLRDSLKGLWGFGFDALSALEGARYTMPGTEHLGHQARPDGVDLDGEPYIFHFPDGNAGIARALVRRLIPSALPGPDTMEALTVTPVDYSQLDRPSHATRLRLGSTAIDVRHVRDSQAVDVTYVQNAQAQRVRGRHVILACYNRVIPYICNEMPAAQVEAIRTAQKIPLVYITVALRNWRAFDAVGYRSFYVPQADLMHSFGLDFPVSIGDYRFAQSRDEPILVHGTYAPAVPDQGYTEREQHILGRQQMLQMSFADYERQIVRQMNGALGDGGFDAGRDIAGITVNRWPHGYAYEYNELFDPPEWNPKNGPHLAGAAQLGRISIANSDAAAYAYVNGAIDAAVRAVNEQLS